LQLPEKALMLQMINFSQLLESLLRFFGTFHVEHLEMANGHTIDVCPGYCPTSADQPGHHLSFLKSNSRSSTFRKTGKEIQLNFPPIEESGPRENGSARVEPQQLFQIPPFAAIFRTRLARRLELRMNWNF